MNVSGYIPENNNIFLKKHNINIYNVLATKP